MNKISRVIFFVVSMLLLTCAVDAEEVSREQVKGLDEQVQEIKADVLGIAAQLNQLEEMLLYPSETQLAVFLSLAEGESFRLDSVEIQLGGVPVASHLYTFKELEGLEKGGVQRVYTGNVRTGVHELQVTIRGKTGSGEDLLRTANFPVRKEVGPRFVEVALASWDITVKSW